MKMDFEKKINTLQMEADGIAAIIAAVDNTMQDYDENEAITAIMMLAKMSKTHADNIQDIISMMDRGERIVSNASGAVRNGRSFLPLFLPFTAQFYPLKYPLHDRIKSDGKI